MKRKRVVLAAIGVATCMCFCWAITATTADQPSVSVKTEGGKAQLAVTQVEPNVQGAPSMPASMSAELDADGMLLGKNIRRLPPDAFETHGVVYSGQSSRQCEYIAYDSAVGANWCSSFDFNDTGVYVDLSDDVEIIGTNRCICEATLDMYTFAVVPAYNLTCEIWDACPDEIGATMLGTDTVVGVPTGWQTVVFTFGAYPGGVPIPDTNPADPPPCQETSFANTDIHFLLSTDSPDYSNICWILRDCDDEVENSWFPEIGCSTIYGGNHGGTISGCTWWYGSRCDPVDHIVSTYGLQLKTEQCVGQGACCYTDGTCGDDVSINDCILAGGEFMGDGVLCSELEFNCNGACCHINGSCTYGSKDACTDDYTEPWNVWMGYNTNCSPAGDVECGQPCDPDCSGLDYEQYETPCVVGVHLNDGCNMEPDPPVFESIECGETVCGTYWLSSAENSRDTDWYQINVTLPTEFTWTVEGTYPTVIGLVEYEEGYEGSGDCAHTTDYISPADVVPATPCTLATITTACLHPGTYWFFVATQQIPEGAVVELPCSDYKAGLTCVAPCAPPPSCTIQNMQGGASFGYLSFLPCDWLKIWIDPADCVAEGQPVYPFLLRNVTIPIWDRSGFTDYVEGTGYGTLVLTIDIECAYSLGGDPCSGPGEMIYLSAPITIVVDATNLGVHDVELDMETLFPPFGLCMGGPFFISIHWESWDGDPAMVPTPVWDDLTADACHQWIRESGETEWTDWLVHALGPGWIDLDVEGDTVGYQDYDPSLPCSPEECPLWQEDIFPSNLYITVEFDDFAPYPYVTTLHLNSYGRSDATVYREPGVLGVDLIPTEMNVLEVGNNDSTSPAGAPADGMVGPVTVRERADKYSAGMILPSGYSGFDVWAEFETYAGLGYTKVYHPMWSEFPLVELPPWDTYYRWPPYPGVFLKGDVNGDGKVNGLDIQCFIECFLGLPLSDPNCDCARADMDGDGVVVNDTDDVTLFVEALLYGASSDPIPIWVGDTIIGRIIEIVHHVKPAPWPGACCYDSTVHGSAYCQETATEDDCLALPDLETFISYTPATYCVDTDPLCGGGACCDTVGGCTRVYNAGECAAPSVFYQDDTCDPNMCEGACCLTDVVGISGECEVRPRLVGCPSTMFALGEDCDPNPCRGACCMPTGDCLYISQDHCDDQGGEFLGYDTVCTPNPCALGCPLGTLYDQAADRDGAYYKSDTDGDVNYAPQIVYDNFTAGQGYEICDLHWWGTPGAYDGEYIIACDPVENPMAFEINFWADDGTGQPNTTAAVCTYSFPAVTAVEKGEFVYEYSVVLSPCCYQDDDAAEWVSIQGTGGDATCWFWWLQDTDDTGDDKICVDSGAGVECDPDTPDTSFCLTP